MTRSATITILTGLPRRPAWRLCPTRTISGNAPRKIRATRGWFTAEIARLGYKVVPSSGNFLFVSPPDRDGQRVYEGLFAQKILVRHFTDPLLKHGLRISIGTQE